MLLSVQPGVRLRLLRASDFDQWREARLANRDLIEPFWQASTESWSERHTLRLWVREVLERRRASTRGESLSWAIEVSGELRGQLQLTALDLSDGCAELGIWVDGRLAGRRIARSAIEVVTDHAFGELGLRRVTAPIAVDNARMRSVARAVDFGREATMRRYLRTGLGRADHESWVLGPTGTPHEPRAVRPSVGFSNGPFVRSTAARSWRRRAMTTVESLRYVASVTKAALAPKRARTTPLAAVAASGTGTTRSTSAGRDDEWTVTSAAGAAGTFRVEHDAPGRSAELSLSDELRTATTSVLFDALLLATECLLAPLHNRRPSPLQHLRAVSRNNVPGHHS